MEHESRLGWPREACLWTWVLLRQTLPGPAHLHVLGVDWVGSQGPREGDPGGTSEKNHGSVVSCYLKAAISSLAVALVLRPGCISGTPAALVHPRLSPAVASSRLAEPPPVAPM